MTFEPSQKGFLKILSVGWEPTGLSWNHWSFFISLRGILERIGSYLSMDELEKLSLREPM